MQGIPRALRVKESRRQVRNPDKRWNRHQKLHTHKPGAITRRKFTIRVKARDEQGRAVYFKSRIHSPQRTIRRWLTLGGLKAEKITR